MTGPVGREPALELALPHALLGLVAGGRRAPVLRCYRPPPTVAFGRRDVFLPGFANAASSARRQGFTPVIRGAGGRAAAYHEECVIFDQIMAAGDSMTGVQERFAEKAERQSQALRRLGVDAGVGEVPGEYCPGEFSVNARGARKLIGAAQRIVRGGWLLSSVVVVRSPAQLRAVLEDVYAELGLEWDPLTVGSIADEVADLSVEDVERALLATYADRYRLIAATLADEELMAAVQLLDRHRVSV